MADQLVRYYRRIIRITATDSPNVRFAEAQLANGITPTDEMLVPGVLSWGDYQQRLAMWDPVLQCIGLEAKFWFGPDTLMFPPQWLNAAEVVAQELDNNRTPRKVLGIGIDPGEGQANTAMAAVDELGLIDLATKRTLDTSIIPDDAIRFWEKHNLSPECVIFDAGGGGIQHANELRKRGYPVKTVGFGEAPTDPPKRRSDLEDRIEMKERRAAFMNRRAQMYSELRDKLDPGLNPSGFGLPRRYNDLPWQLRKQLAPIPLLRGSEGKLRMLPKSKRDPDSKEKTLTELIGRSPDEADALVLALHAVLHGEEESYIGAY